MNEHQRLFLVQARSDFKVFELLRETSRLPVCHALHYLQMSTELLGKARAWKDGPRSGSHRAFVGFLRSLMRDRRAQKQMGYTGKNEQWEHLIRKSVPLADEIERLAPALAGDGPNPEYPWPRDAPEHAPVEHVFQTWQELQAPSGLQFLELTRHLFDRADEYL